MNACGKKNPEIQNVLGVPFFIQFVKKVIRSFKSTVHEERGFSDRKPFSDHSPGTYDKNIFNHWIHWVFFAIIFGIFSCDRFNYLIIEERVSEFFEFFGENDESFETFFEVSEWFFHNNKHAIISNEFLDENCIHGFVVTRRVEFRNRFDVEYFRCALLDIQRDFFDNLLAWFSVTRLGTRLHWEDRFE